MSFTEDAVYQIAEEVNSLSLGYQLSHATVACDLLLQSTLKSHCDKEIEELNKKREQAYRSRNTSEFVKLTEEIGQVHKKHFHIFVEYMDYDSIEAARTVYVDNQLIICLPKYLKDRSIDSNGSYTKHVEALRKLMAHELGHAILHTDDIIEAGYIMGSKAISNGSKEIEANWFRDKLLELRHIRNTQIRKDRIIEKGYL